MVAFRSKFKNDKVSLSINNCLIIDKVKMSTNRITSITGRGVVCHQKNDSIVSLILSRSEKGEIFVDTIDYAIRDLFPENKNLIKLRIIINGIVYKRNLKMKGKSAIYIDRKQKFPFPRIEVITRENTNLIH